MKLYDETQGATGEADELPPPDELAVAKPKINAVPGAPALPGVQPAAVPVPAVPAIPPVPPAVETAVPFAGVQPASALQSAPGAPSQTQSFNLPNAATQFPGADGTGPTTGGSSPGAFYQRFDQSQAAPLSPEEQSKATRIMQGDQSLMNEYKQQYGAGWFDKWGADQDMYDKRLRNQTATGGDINALSGMSGQKAWDVISGKTTIGGSQDGSQMGTNYMNALRSMTPDQRTQFLNQWPEGSYDRAMIEGSLAAQGITSGSGDTGQRWDGKTQNNGPMASAIPVYSGNVQGTGTNSQGLAGYGAPSSPPTPGGAPALPSVAPAPTAGPNFDEFMRQEQERLAGEAKHNAGPGGFDKGILAGEGYTATPGKVGTTYAPPAGSPATGLPGVGAAPSGAFTQTPTTAENALTNQTLDYGPLTDRFKVAQSELENWDKTSNPQFQADLRDAMRKAAAGGALGSGMLQTSIGDIAQNRELTRQGMGTSFLNNALTGSIGDAKDRANFAAGQQGFQAGQQQTAFGQGVTEAELNDRLTGNAFSRALQTLIAGQSGNPADTQLALSGIFGNAGADAGNALSSLIGNKTANGGAADTSGYLQMILDAIKKQGGGTTATAGGSTYDGLQ